MPRVEYESSSDTEVEIDEPPKQEKRQKQINISNAPELKPKRERSEKQKAIAEKMRQALLQKRQGDLKIKEKAKLEHEE